MRNVLSAIPLPLGLLVLVGACAGSAAGPPSSVPPLTATQTPTATAVTGLKPADSQLPAAGICAPPPAGDAVTFTIDVDVPSPRCARILPHQRVRVENRTDEPVRVVLAGLDVTLQPGAGVTFDVPVGAYLAPGVHFVGTSLYGGSGPELWVLGD